MLTDLELVDRCRDGSEPAFRELYYRHFDRVFRLVGRIFGPGVDANDVVQDVFLEVHRSLHRFRGDSAFSTWLHRITVNVAMSALRKKLRSREAPDAATQVATDPMDPTRQLEAREEVRTLYRALDELPDQNRVAFVLFELEGMTLEELADITGVVLHTAAARLRRARLELARVLGRGIERRRRAAGEVER